MREAIREYVGSDLVYQWFAHHFTTLTTEKIDTWDFQWMYTMLAHRRVAVTSSVNFVNSLGFDQEATHTTFREPYADGLKTYDAVGAETVGARQAWASHDRLHDRIYGEIVMTKSRLKIEALRAASRFPLTLDLLGWLKN
jgi:hypothetical protein